MAKPATKPHKRCRAKRPDRCRCPRPWTVRCPVCRRTYRAVLPWAWAVRCLRRTCDYPPLVCRGCQQAEDLARRHGGKPEDWRNPEMEAC